MKTYSALFLSLILASPLFAQDAHKCKTPSGYVYQDSPCKVLAPSSRTVAPIAAEQTPAATITPKSDTQSRLERENKYLADRAYNRERTAASERILQCENEAIELQSRFEQTANARLTEYVPNSVGIAQMQLDEERRQTALTGLQSKVTSKRAECDNFRREYANKFEKQRLN